MLLIISVSLIGLFGVAWWLNPYEPDGHPRALETHLQLGLPPCTFRNVIGLPCPSCGLTTSFALLAHGDLLNSLRANAVGTLLAIFFILLIPWAVWSSIQGRLYGIVSFERPLLVTVGFFLGLLIVRWLWVVGPIAWSKYLV